jgi:hypothetical protein
MNLLPKLLDEEPRKKAVHRDLHVPVAVVEGKAVRGPEHALFQALAEICQPPPLQGLAGSTAEIIDVQHVHEVLRVGQHGFASGVTAAGRVQAADRVVAENIFPRDEAFLGPGLFENLEQLVENGFGVRVVAAETLVGPAELFDVGTEGRDIRDLDPAGAMPLLERLDHLLQHLVGDGGQQAGCGELWPELVLEVKVVTSEFFKLSFWSEAAIFRGTMLAPRATDQDVFGPRRRVKRGQL